MLLDIKNKFRYVLGVVDGTWKQYKIIIAAYNTISYYQYLESIDEIQKYLNPHVYPSRKAFRQITSDILKLKSDISIFLKYWNIFELKYYQIKKAYQAKKYTYVSRVIKQPILIDNEIFILPEITKKLTIIGQRINIDCSDIQDDFDALHMLHEFSMIFASKYQEDSIIAKFKKRIFEDVSELYQEKSFGGAASLLSNFVLNTDFTTGNYTDINGKTYQDYFQYCIEEEQEEERWWQEHLKSKKSETDEEEYLETEQSKWCKDNGWSDLFFQEGKWYAFAPSAVIPQEIPLPFSLKTFFGSYQLLEILMFVIFVLPIVSAILFLLIAFVYKFVILIKAIFVLIIEIIVSF